VTAGTERPYGPGDLAAIDGEPSTAADLLDSSMILVMPPWTDPNHATEVNLSALEGEPTGEAVRDDNG
jgi:hypothetical protein